MTKGQSGRAGRRGEKQDSVQQRNANKANKELYREMKGQNKKKKGQNCSSFSSFLPNEELLLVMHLGYVFVGGFLLLNVQWYISVQNYSFLRPLISTGLDWNNCRIALQVALDNSA
ncbi:UNVERIFIED_CONTAM: hypothetical protein K2H54_069624 [Gekko kuhli]